MQFSILWNGWASIVIKTVHVIKTKKQNKENCNKPLYTAWVLNSTKKEIKYIEPNENKATQSKKKRKTKSLRKAENKIFNLDRLHIKYAELLH